MTTVSRFRFQKQSVLPVLKRLMLVVLFVASMLRLAYFLREFSLNSLQVDFSAFYTAGEALNYGLSPYDNNISHSPPVWDGINDYQHSRFLYPPLVANLFQPVALLPYFYAKMLWSLFTLLCIAFALYLTSNIFAIGTPQKVLLLGILVCWYYPLLTHLERGQIDAITLLLLTISIYFLVRKEQRLETLSGLLLAVAVLLKLHSIYVLPFLVARKHWQALKGFAIAALLISIASIATPSGRTHLKDYLINELPRIANYAQPDHGDVLLDPELIQDMINDLPDGYTIKDGYVYAPVFFDFVSNATLVRPLHDRLSLSGLQFNFAVLSFAVYGLFFSILLMWQQQFDPAENPAPEKELLYWQMVLIAILLSAPLTHVMNAVWMLPVFVMAITSYSKLKKARQKLGYGLLVTGMVVMGIPDGLFSALGFPIRLQLLDDKYLVGEILVIIGCLFSLAEPTHRSSSGSPRSGRER